MLVNGGPSLNATVFLRFFLDPGFVVVECCSCAKMWGGLLPDLRATPLQHFPACTPWTCTLLRPAWIHVLRTPQQLSRVRTITTFLNNKWHGVNMHILAVYEDFSEFTAPVGYIRV